MNKLLDYRNLFIICLIFVFGLLYFYSNYYRSTICAVENCTATLMLGFWYPLQTFGIVGALFLVPFLVLPFKYFYSWLRYVAWWLIPVGALVVYITPPMRSFWFDRNDTVIIVGIFAALLTAGYLLYLRFGSKIDTQF